MFDPESENFRPPTLRENYLYRNRLQVWNYILVWEEMINDLKFKLQRECEKSESWRTEMLQKVQEKKEMIQASSSYKDTIVKLNEELSKCIRKNEKMLGYWTEFSKLEVQCVTQNYESTIQILKR